MPFYILIVRNRIRYDIWTALNSFAEWIRAHTPLSPIITVVDTDFEPSFKDFGVVLQGGELGTRSDTAWGIDGIKDTMRNCGYIPSAKNNVVIFLYDRPANFPHELGAWTYPNALNLAAFIESPTSQEEAAGPELVRILTHEICHAFHRLCWFKGIPTSDTMDLYDKEYEINAPLGNRARNLLAVSSYWDQISQAPVWQWLQNIKAVVVALQNFFNNRTVSKIQRWAEAIKSKEGFFAPGQNPQYPGGTKAWKNNNPGNFKFNSFVKTDLGAISADKDGFAIFPTYQDGFNALKMFLEWAAGGQLRNYSSSMSLIQFFGVYAPSSDKNDPNAYALFVAQKIGVDPQTPITNLLS